MSGESGRAADPILVVDDETIVLQSIRLILRHAGYPSVGASSGSEAIRLLEGPSRFSAAVVDLVLPDIEGEQVLRRASELRPEMPLVAMSGYGHRLSQSKAAAPASATMAKPFDRRSLIDTVEALLTASTTRRAKE